MIVEKVTKRKTIRTRTKPGKHAAETTPAVDLRLIIEREAYLRAERRGFEPGHELEDWLAAEHSVGSVATA
jgi:Protein of unknown function (DUF2934)